MKKLISCVRPGVFEARASALAPGQRVDQRGFADVRAAGEADLEPVGRRQAVHRDDALEKLGLPGEQHAARLRAVSASGASASGKGQAASVEHLDRSPLRSVARLGDLGVDAEILVSPAGVQRAAACRRRAAPVSGLAVVARQRVIGSRTSSSAAPMRQCACRSSRIPAQGSSPSSQQVAAPAQRREVAGPAALRPPGARPG